MTSYFRNQDGLAASDLLPECNRIMQQIALAGEGEDQRYKIQLEKEV